MRDPYTYPDRADAIDTYRAPEVRLRISRRMGSGYPDTSYANLTDADIAEGAVLEGVDASTALKLFGRL